MLIRKALLLSAVLATGACGASGGSIEVRAIPDPATKLRQGGGSLAEAQGQLALGNTGLALEGFRKVLRTEGDSAGAYAGIARSYAAMGRNDLARVNYEAALALAPRDAALLLALAPTLESLGKNAEAAEARAEARRLTTPATPPSPPTAAPASLPVEIAGGGRDALPNIVAAPQPSRIPETPVQSQASTPAPSEVHAVARLASSITVELPPARPLARVRAQNISSAAAAAPQFGSIVGQALRSLRAALTAPAAQPSPPRLVRLSMGEVALVTTAKPLWRAELVSRTRLSTTVRWVPIQTAAARPNIRILNAARSAGLAARSRNMLLDRGWRRIEIGEAPQIRATSLVIYPASRGMLGRSLAAQFGCASRKGEGDLLVVLLGRDRAGTNSVRT